MDTLRGFGRSCYDFGRSIVEWRSPLTAPYLMIINSAFWATSLYADRMTQLQALVSFSAVVFGWDVLLSPTHERNIATHMLFWPVQSLWRTLGVALNLYSAHILRANHVEQAFCTAYCALGCLLINPVWDYYDTNHKIADTVKYSGNQVYVFLQSAVIHPFFVVIKAIKYVVCFEFLPGMLASIRQAFSSTGGGIKGLWLTFYAWLCAGFSAIINWWRTCVLTPIGNAFRRFGSFLRYWLCAHWWPDFVSWLKIRFGRPLQRLFNYICFCLVYVFCGHWVKPVSRIIWKYVCALSGFLYRNAVVPMKGKLIEWGHATSLLIRQMLHRTALAIRDSVLWPICLGVADVAKQVYNVIHEACIRPVLDYVYVRYKKIEDVIYIYFLGPVCEKVINNIPEKSPFCDDSDEELDGLLPDELSEDEAPPRPTQQASVPIPSTSKPIPEPIPQKAPVIKQETKRIEKIVTPKKQKSEIPSEEDLLPDLEFSNDDEDHEFAVGLTFPTILASESSDEEFDLNRGITKVKRRKRSTELRRKRREVEPVVEEEDLVPKRVMKKNEYPPNEQRQPPVEPPKPMNSDDHFEILG